MPLSSRALITWELAQRELQLADSQQTTVERLIESASQMAESIIGRTLMKIEESSTITMDGNGKKLLILPVIPVISVTSVHVSASRDFSGDPLDSSLYSLDAEAGFLRKYGGVWPKGEDNIQVIYSAGWETAPEDVQTAVLEIVAWSLTRFQSRTIGMRSTGADGIQTNLEVQVPMNAKRILEAYRG